jgi:uncharacterized protein YkwD
VIALSRKISILAVLGILAAAALAVSPKASAGSLLAPDHFCPNPALSAPARTQIDAMLCYHAYARRRLGVRGLHRVAPLYRSAGLKAQWISMCRTFTHNPCGRPFESAFSSANYAQGSRAFGENLAWGSGSRGRAREMFEIWLHSPGHRENISSPEWREIGVALLHSIHLFGSENVTLWVVHFGSR